MFLKVLFKMIGYKIIMGDFNENFLFIIKLILKFMEENGYYQLVIFLIIENGIFIDYVYINILLI